MLPDSAERNAWDQIAAWINAIAGDIRYGKVEITLHDARVVQLEVTEKFRAPAEPPSAVRPGQRPATR